MKTNTGTSKSTASCSDEKQPGDPTYPLTSYSLTITKNSGDIISDALLGIMEDFLKTFCTRGIIQNYI